jgi:threonine/homoserine/homoserine lactone efflux protein
MLFLSGFFLSLLGSLPPGLIGLSVAQTAVQRGLRAALALGAGAAAAEFFQAWLAAEAAGWFVRHPAVEQGLRWAAVPVFLGLGLWLMLRPASAPRPPAEPAPGRSALRLFAQGILLSAFNLLAVPYWLAYCAGLRSNGWWEEGWQATTIFSAGVMAGTFAALALYAGAAHWATSRSALVARYANRAVGAIFLGLGLWTLLKLWG